MNPLSKTYHNIKYLMSSKQGLSNPVPGNTLGVTSLSLTKAEIEGRQAIYPQWFFSARLGQPRNINTVTLRDLSKSVWVQMVLNTFKKQIYAMDWELVLNKDVEETDELKADMEKVTEFFNMINVNEQTIDDINSEVITDLGEIDAAVFNYVYTAESYEFGKVPIYDAVANIVAEEDGLILKPFGSRELVQVKTVDGASMLKQVDLHKNLLQIWQYSFKHPRQNPTPFSKDEVKYMMMNSKSYSIYGFSPVQSIQQVLELLIQGTRYNKDLFKNNAIPDLLATLPKLPQPELTKLKRMWNNEYQGKPHQVGFINWPIENLHKLAESNRDLEWLDGQKWYFKLVFGAFGVSPTEAGFFENANMSNDEGQARVTVRNAMKPHLKIIENAHNTKTIPELLQKEKPGFTFKYKPKDHAQEQIEFTQNMAELNTGTMTINEYRKMMSREAVEWGDEPLRKPMDNINDAFQAVPGRAAPKEDPSKKPNKEEPEPKKDPKKEGEKAYKKSFEEFMVG